MIMDESFDFRVILEMILTFIDIADHSDILIKLCTIFTIIYINLYIIYDEFVRVMVIDVKEILFYQ